MNRCFLHASPFFSNCGVNVKQTHKAAHARMFHTALTLSTYADAFLRHHCASTHICLLCLYANVQH